MSSPLLLTYIKEHAAEVAAQLEGKPVASIKAFIEELPDNECSYLISHLSIKYVDAVASRINDEMLEYLCKHQPPYVVLRIYNTLSEANQIEFLPKLPHRYRWYLKHLSAQSSLAISTLMSYDFLSLPEYTKVAECLKSLKHVKHKISALFTHDEKNKVTGEIDIINLYSQSMTATLKECAQSLRHAQAPTANIEDVLHLKIWGNKSAIPIVDHDRHLLGIVTTNALLEQMIQNEDAERISFHDSADQITNAIYSVLNSIASSYRKGSD